MLNSFQLLPVICFTCARNIADKELLYKQKLKKYKSDTFETMLNELGFVNYCCRIYFMNPTTKFLDVEDRRVVDGEYPVDGTISYLDRNKNSTDKMVEKYREQSSEFIKLDWESVSSVSIKKRVPSQISESRKKDLISAIKEDEENLFSKYKKTSKLPEIKQMEPEPTPEEDLDFGEVLLQEEDDYSYVSRPEMPGVPFIVNADKVTIDMNLKMVSVGFEGDNHREMITRVVGEKIYLAI